MGTIPEGMRNSCPCPFLSEEPRSGSGAGALGLVQTDIYAPDMHQPARVEYWDDEIDSLASFDLLTQRRDGSLEKIYLSPAREAIKQMVKHKILNVLGSNDKI